VSGCGQRAQDSDRTGNLSQKVDDVIELCVLIACEQAYICTKHGVFRNIHLVGSDGMLDMCMSEAQARWAAMGLDEWDRDLVDSEMWV
jgi:hypothetical protein